MSSLMVRLSRLAMDCARFSMPGGKVTERVRVFRMDIFYSKTWHD